MDTQFQLPKQSDFSDGTTFYIKEFDVPLTLEPTNDWYNWFGGKPKKYDVSNLKRDIRNRVSLYCSLWERGLRRLPIVMQVKEAGESKCCIVMMQIQTLCLARKRADF
jgi:hypothetical protein